MFLPAVAHVLLCERQRRGDDSQVLHWRARVSWGAFLAVVVVGSRTPVSSLCFPFWPVTRRCHGLRVWPWRPRCLGVERRPSTLKNGSRTVRATDEDLSPLCGLRSYQHQPPCPTDTASRPKRKSSAVSMCNHKSTTQHRSFSAGRFLRLRYQ